MMSHGHHEQDEVKYPSPNDIVIFQPEFEEFGGEERVILALSKELHAQGKPHSVLCYQDQIGLAKYASWPLKVYALDPGNNPVSKLLALRKCLASLHRRGSPIPVLFNIQSAYHAGVAVKTPYHLRIPDTYSLLGDAEDKSILRRSYNTIRHFATARGIRRSHQFVTNTIALRDEMEQLYGRRAEVIYLGGFRNNSHHESKHITTVVELLTVSRLQTSKRIDWILTALSEVRRNASQYPMWRLHIAGSGPEHEVLQKMSEDLNLSDSVIFHGFVSDQQLQDLYERCHLFLLPARQGYGLPAIESLYNKLALVVSEDSGVVEILENADSVAVVRGGITEFTTAVKEMLQRISKPGFFDAPPLTLPSEESWAKEMIRYCKW